MTEEQIQGTLKEMFHFESWLIRRCLLFSAIVAHRLCIACLCMCTVKRLARMIQLAEKAFHHNKACDIVAYATWPFFCAACRLDQLVGWCFFTFDKFCE